MLDTEENDTVSIRYVSVTGIYAHHARKCRTIYACVYLMPHCRLCSQLWDSLKLEFKAKLKIWQQLGIKTFTEHSHSTNTYFWKSNGVQNIFNSTLDASLVEEDVCSATISNFYITSQERVLLHM